MNKINKSEFFFQLWRERRKRRRIETNEKEKEINKNKSFQEMNENMIHMWEYPCDFAV